MVRPIDENMTAVDVTADDMGRIVITLDKDYAKQVKDALEVATDEEHDFSSLYLTMAIVIDTLEG